LESLNDWTVSLKNGRLTRIVTIDFARAFDTICYSKLLFKLNLYGFRGNLLKIIESFLRNRTQCVSINGITSASRNIKSGVPQGSVLGPLLFIIFINDLPNIFPPQVTTKFFADDAKLYTEIKSNDDIVQLQHCLDLLSEWARDWQLEISIPKCFIFDVSHSKNACQYDPINIDGLDLECVSELKDLGVILDAHLKFSPHITQMVASAKQRLFLMFRAFNSREINPMLCAFKSYILPLVNYCSTVWSPSLFGDICAVESVQRLFTRKLVGMKDLSYISRLAALNLPTLELRRMRADLTMCFKIINGHVAGIPENFGLTLSGAGTRRGHPKKLFVHHSRIDARKNFFGSRVAGQWNSLPLSLVNSESVHSFKKNLINWDDLNVFF